MLLVWAPTFGTTPGAPTFQISGEHLLRRERQPGPQTQIPLGSESPPYQCSHDYLKSATVKTAFVSPQSTEEGRDIAVGSGLTPGGLERRSCLTST